MSDALALSARPTPWTLVARPGLLAGSLALLAFVALAALSILRFDAYQAGLLDLDIQDQVIWNTAHGHPFASTVLKENTIHVAEHLAFSLTPFALIYAVLPDTRIPLAGQALALAASSLAVYLYARHALGSWPQALLVQASYLLMPLLATMALDDFHPVVVAVAPLAFGAYLLLIGRAEPGLALLALAVAAEEECALPVLGLGMLVACRGRWRLGAGMALAAAVYLLLATQVVMPAFQTSAGRQGGPNRTLAHFNDVRNDLSVLANRLRPARLWDAFTWHELPGGATALASPLSLLPAMPTFAALMLQNEDLGNRYKMHWAAVMLPFFGFAAADGIRRLSRAPLGRPLALALLAAGTLVTYFSLSPLPGSADYNPSAYRPGPHQADIARALPLVPPDIPLLASNTLVAYLNHRREIYVYPPALHYSAELATRLDTVGFAVLDLFDRSTQSGMGQKDANLLRRNPPPIVWSPAHKILFVMQRFPAPSTALTPPPLFGDVLQLDGYDVARRGSSVELTLQWRVVHHTYFSYQRVVELVDRQGAVVASSQEMPLLVMAGTNDWRTGLRIVDRVTLGPLPAGTTLDSLHFRVGWTMLRESTNPLRDLALPGGPRQYESPILSLPGSG